ncbi:MAG: hypothetical protein II258_05320 [Spirochaetales bacterium]|nr:hypothetical protein [Spirochaetales bacterium]
MKDKFIRILLIFTMALFVFSCKNQAQKSQYDKAKFIKDYQGKRIVGYFPARYAVSADYDAGTPYLTHLLLWFYNPDEEYNFYCDEAQEHEVMQLIKKAKHDNCKIFLSIAGGAVHAASEYADRYRYLLRPENHNLFAQKLVELAKHYKADGIDLDLEGAMILPEFSDFIVLAKEKLSQNKIELSGAFNIYGGKKLTDEAVHAFDFINIMAYNESGLFEKKLRNHSSYYHAQKHLNYWTDTRKVAAEKVILGVPFYGWYNEFDLAGELLEKRSISFSNVNKHFHNLSEKDNLVEIETDTRRIVFTFNGVDLSAQKTQLSKNYGGIMIWHIAQDSDDLKLLRTFADNLQYKPENVENSDVSDDLTGIDVTSDLQDVTTDVEVELIEDNGELRPVRASDLLPTN